jgi:hypothetical protein
VYFNTLGAIKFLLKNILILFFLLFFVKPPCIQGATVTHILCNGIQVWSIFFQDNIIRQEGKFQASCCVPEIFVQKLMAVQTYLCTYLAWNFGVWLLVFFFEKLFGVSFGRFEEHLQINFFPEVEAVLCPFVSVYLNVSIILSALVIDTQSLGSLLNLRMISVI